MVAQLRSLWRDEAGFILSAEMVIILTISVLGMVTGLVCLQNAVLGEFADLSLAFQSLNQSYATPWYRGCWKWWGGITSFYSGSMFIDVFDGCVYGHGGAAYQTFDNGCEVVSGTCVNTPAATGTVHTEATTVAPAVPVQPCPQTPAQPVPSGTVLPGVPCDTCK